MARLETDDLTDRLIKPIVVADTGYLDLADDALEDLADAMDVDTDDISDPIHYRVKRYLIAWVNYEVCKDNMGRSPQKLNEQGVQDDPYETKLKVFGKVLAEKKAQITPEILKDEADQPEEFAKTSTEIFRA